MKKILLSISLFIAVANAQIPTNGLVAWYPFNGNANDSSGNGHNGTPYNGAALTTDRFGNPNNAYAFDGYDDEIEVPNSDLLNILGDITISAWFNSAVAPTFRTSYTIVSKRDTINGYNIPFDAQINYQYGIPTDYGKPMFVSAVNNSYQTLESPATISENVWNHIAMVVKSSNLIIYLNDSVILNTTIDNSLRIGNSAPLWIGSGARPDYPAERFSGSIDDIRIYNRALSDSEIQILYNEANPLLPVELTSFTASATSNAVALMWKTATEVNNAGFDIERQPADQQQWTKIGSVAGVGTSNTPHNYSFTDQNLAAETYSYRLKQIDHDGAFVYSQTVRVTIAVPQVLLLSQNYPEPFNPSTMIQFTVPNDGRATLKVYNAIGQEVATLFSDEVAAGVVHQVQFNGSNLATGVYFSRLEFGGKMQVKKMLLLR